MWASELNWWCSLFVFIDWISDWICVLFYSESIGPAHCNKFQSTVCVFNKLGYDGQVFINLLSYSYKTVFCTQSWFQPHSLWTLPLHPPGCRGRSDGGRSGMESRNVGTSIALTAVSSSSFSTLKHKKT